MMAFAPSRLSEAARRSAIGSWVRKCCPNSFLALMLNEDRRKEEAEEKAKGELE